jgi:RNA-directed DNA polymerase
VVHCQSKEEAESVLIAIRDRLHECGLELHPNKTRIVYCKDDDRPGRHEHESLDFLGLHLPTSTREESLGQVFWEHPAGDQREGSQGDPRTEPRLDAGFHSD